MKPGYKILIGLSVVIVAYKFYSNNKAQKEHYIKLLDSILTDIRREDYFKIQSQLEPSLAKTISIEDIKKYTQSLAIKRDYKLELKDYLKDKDKVKIEAILINNRKKVPLTVTIKENNNTYIILKEKVGDLELKGGDNNLLFIQDKNGS